MEPRQIIRSGITASAIAHLSVLMLVLFFTEVHRFGSVTAEPITVDLVSPAEATPPPEKDKTEESLPPAKAEPSDTLDLPSKSAASSASPPATPPPAPPQPQKQAALSTPPPVRQQPSAQPQPQPQSQPQPPATSPVPVYIPPEPDLSLKYHVLLGLPQGLPQDRPGDGFDALASDKADVASSLVTEFRRHLKTCSKLPVSIAPTDNITIKLRVLMTPEGKIAAKPVVVEGTANLKGLNLGQSAIDALAACQPYTMLPVDRYGEWKVLDLSFTPQDF